VIDFHCHLDLYPEPASVADRCHKEGIYVLSVTTTPMAWEGTKRLERPRIRTALGLHPQLAHERKSELALFDRLLPQARYVGEIGLDGAPEFKPHWNDQLHVFRHVLESCSNAGGRILSVHSRRAASQVLGELAAYPTAGTPILHWFSGTVRELACAIEGGCWFSIGLPMLNTKKGRSFIERMPPERVLTESDGPFARVDERPAMPWDTLGSVLN
jgi:TatD DNase family protein